MNDKVLFDTTVIVYAYDKTDEVKHKICRQLIADVAEGNTNGFVSNQVLAELFNVLTTKMAKSLEKGVAEQVIGDFVGSRSWQKISYTAETVQRAAMTSRLSNSPFWDTLIAETMIENEVTTIITENEGDFKKIRGIKVINPFR